jgi:hypothetical protein
MGYAQHSVRIEPNQTKPPQYSLSLSTSIAAMKSSPNLLDLTYSQPSSDTTKSSKPPNDFLPSAICGKSSTTNFLIHATTDLDGARPGGS